ncbi:MAG: phosphatase PAP2 family protein [Agathobacter sp.]|nr:phosphatase PAP2 family protein [Agathobacter sp.]
MSWEFDFLYALQNIHNPVLDKIMIVLSTIGDAGLFWIGVAILLICMKKYRKCGLQVAVAMLLTFIVGNLILKNMIHRDRPCWIDPSITLLVKSPSDFSFPSGHSMNGFTASVSILLCDKKLGIAAVILAAAIAFSRLYNFVHFPTDVIAGIVIGIVSALFVNYLFQRKVHV